MTDYRTLLRIELVERTGRNSNYSKRAFARDLGISPGHLVHVLAGKKKLSTDRASTISEKLDWPKQHKKLFMNLVRLDNARSDSHKALVRADLLKRSSLQTYKKLNPEMFQYVANWYFHAILTLTELKEFKLDLTWISRRLSLQAETVQNAIETLKRLRLINETDGKLQQIKTTHKIDSIPSRAIREHHRQFLEKAASALECQGYEERDFSGSVFAINPRKLPEAKKKIKEFREEMTSLLDDGESNSQVYRLSVQLFRLDRNGDRK